MVKIILVVREVGSLKPDYSLNFEMPQVPAVGDYISVQRPDRPEPYGEDVIVRQVWWRLKHPTTSGFDADPPRVGSVGEVFVECDVAVGPYASEDWLRYYGARADAGEIERFRVERWAPPEAQFKAMGTGEPE